MGTSYMDWLARFEESGSQIVDEYGAAITVKEFMDLVKAKRGQIGHSRIALRQGIRPVDEQYIQAHQRDWLVRYPKVDSTDEWLDSDGHGFSSQDFC